MTDQFGNHLIVIHRDFAALEDAAINPDSGARLRFAVAHQPPNRRHKTARRVFRVQAALHRPAVLLNVALGYGKFFTGSDFDLLFDQVDSGDKFGDRVLDLKARVHLKKIEIALLVGNELDRPGGDIADFAHQRTGLLSHGLARGVVE